jgi:3-hydroxyacyl-[acyl-carrier-protein] dehydratase
MRWIFVDRFLTLEKGRYAKAVKNVSMGEEHLHDHFPSYPVMPNSLIIEALAQTGGLLAGHAFDFKEKVILAKIEKAEFFRMVTPGDQMILEATLVENREEGCKVLGVVSVNGTRVASATLMFVNLRANQAKGWQPENFVFTKEFLALLGVTRLNGSWQVNGARSSSEAKPAL